MADVEISYNNSVIASLNASGSEVLETNGTLMADDVTITYTPNARFVEYQAVTFSTTATSANPVTVQLTPLSSYCITVVIDTSPAAPDSSQYIALMWSQIKIPLAAVNQVGFVLRPNGTIGTDGAMCSFNTTTGVLTIGGPYGHFMSGTTYHVYEFEVDT